MLLKQKTLIATAITCLLASSSASAFYVTKDEAYSSDSKYQDGRGSWIGDGATLSGTDSTEMVFDVTNLNLGTTTETSGHIKTASTVTVKRGPLQLVHEDSSITDVGSLKVDDSYLKVQKGKIQVKEDVSVDRWIGNAGSITSDNGSIAVVESITNSGKISAENGNITAQSLTNTGKVNVKSFNVKTVRNTGGDSSIVADTIGSADNFVNITDNSGSIESTSDAYLLKINNSGQVKIGGDLSIKQTDKTSFKNAAGGGLIEVTGTLKVDSITANEGEIKVGSLGTEGQTVSITGNTGTVEAGKAHIQGALSGAVKVTDTAYFTGTVRLLDGGAENPTIDIKNLDIGQGTQVWDEEPDDNSPAGKFTVSGKMTVRDGVTMTVNRDFSVEGTDTEQAELELQGSARLMFRENGKSTIDKLTFADTTEDALFQTRTTSSIDSLSVSEGGTANLNAYRAEGQEGEIKFDITNLQVDQNGTIRFHRSQAMPGDTSTTVEIENLTMKEGSTLANYSKPGDSDSSAFENFKITQVDGQGSTIANSAGGSMEIGTISGQNNEIYVENVADNVKVSKNESTNLTIRAAGENGDLYGVDAVGEALRNVVTKTDQSYVAALDEGLVNGATSWRVGADGSYTQSSTESTTMTALKQFNNATLAQWRYEVNHLSQRLGDVRNNLGSAGAWARLYGADSKISDGVTTEVKTTTIQVGGDATVGNNWVVGGAFSYTSMDGDISNGTADGETYTLSAYASGFFDCGGYVDIIGRVGRLSTDIDTHTTGGALFDGSYDNTALGLSIETGYHWALSNTFYVEPQVELSYGYVFGDDFTTSTQVKVEQDNFQTLVGRLGARFGANFPKDVGSLYLHASVNHEFLGDNDFDAAVAGGVKQHFSSELDGTWVSYGLGLQIYATESLSIYGTLERANGDNYQDDYRYSAGLRYVF